MPKLTAEKDLDTCKEKFKNSKWIAFKFHGSSEIAFIVKLAAVTLCDGYSLKRSSRYLSWPDWSSLFFRAIGTHYNAAQCIRKLARGTTFVEAGQYENLLDIDITKKKSAQPNITFEEKNFGSFISF
ncbi:hypothetical protein [Aeromonas allosaccharophila]|uniref:hypothetical protein n=1 Tax=Aeromonas allosaccharophila TaxID=656 RepID=UPI0011181613|nr:hypothetical protein [Aeromonas allosaccharophila]